MSKHAFVFPDTVFNLPNNVEVLMEVSSESNIDGGSGNEQSTASNENNNNGNTRKLTARCRIYNITC